MSESALPVTHSGPEGSDGREVSGIQRELTPGHGARLGGDRLVMGNLADPPGKVGVGRVTQPASWLISVTSTNG
jgi:hypothetical protein